ncbi:copper chaperone PCu(A)C [Methylocapsa aurea]|uniref:copper chaperone PCu(A)C n=1 Tax=Methylocapsa aurea TaxID=663610 RepID=UPI00068BDE78|nr:copper chaperone PCu(A)C [Methylocapsa aurea]
MKVSVSPIMVSLALAIGLCAPAWAHQESAGKLKIAHPWVRASAEGAPETYACIIEISNESDEPETLLSATIEGAGKGVLYELTEANGHFTSKPLEQGLVIKPHGKIELTPTTYQFKFGKVTKALKEDTEVLGTLVFEKLHSVPIHFMVESDDTAPKEDADASKEDHSGHQHKHGE